MGLFKGLKKVFNPGGAVFSKVINDGRDYKGVLDYAMNGQKQAEKNQAAQKAAQQAQYASNVKPPYSPAPNGMTSYPALSLGWTNGGYNYANGGVGGGGGGSRMPPPMSFAPPQQLQPPVSGGSMLPAGAQPSGPPTMQQYQIGMLRRPGGAMMA